MLVVVMDTSTPAVTAAVCEITAGAVELLAQRVSVNARAHGELLGPALTGALAEAKAAPRDLAAVVSGLGPGPFTGLRVGLVTAAAFGQALGIPTYGVCSLDGIGAVTTGAVLVATDARRKEVYWAAYRDGARVEGPAVHRPGDLGDELTRLGLTVDKAAGEGALRYADVLGLAVLAEPLFPVPRVLAELAAGRVLGSAASEPLTPLYLRRPDAVEPGAPKPVGS